MATTNTTKKGNANKGTGFAAPTVGTLNVPEGWEFKNGKLTKKKQEKPAKK